MVFFWNNRNARRKQSGTLFTGLMSSQNRSAQKMSALIMHTDPRDPHGQDLQAIITDLDIGDGRIILSKEKVPPNSSIIDV